MNSSKGNQYTCPYCKEKSTNYYKCSKCGKDLIKKFTFEGKEYGIRVLYQDWNWEPTSQYKKIFEQIFKQGKRKQPFNLDELLEAILNDTAISGDNKITINGFVIFRNFAKYPVVQIWTRTGSKIFENVERYAKDFGVYLHVTGPPLPRELISCWIDMNEDILLSKDDLKTNTINMDDKQVIIERIAGDSNQNCIKLKLAGLQILLDVGINWSKEKLDPKEIDFVVLSHAHSDHAQGLRKLYFNNDCSAPIITTRATMELLISREKEYKEILKMNKGLLKDPNFCALSKEDQELKQLEIASKKLDKMFSKILRKAIFISYNDEIELGEDFRIKFLQAGHYPGGIMTLFIVKEFSLLYSGDFNLLEFEPIASCREIMRKMNVKPEVVICDGSAANLRFPKEALTKARLYSEVLETFNNNGITLLLTHQSIGAITTFFIIHRQLLERNGKRIPFYFDSRTWEQMCILRDRADELAPKIVKKIEEHLDPFHSVMIRRLDEEYPHLGGIGLVKAVEEGNCVISIDAKSFSRMSEDEISTIDQILSCKKNLVIVIGPPRNQTTLDLISGRKKIVIQQENGNEYKEIAVNCKILNWDFESHQIFNYHPDKDQLMEFFDNLLPKRVVFFHSSPASLIDFRRELSKRPYIRDHVVLEGQNPMYHLHRD